MSDVLNPGTIRVWGYNKPQDIKFSGIDAYVPEVVTYKGVRCAGFDFYKFWLKQKVNTLLFRSIIRKQKQNAIKACRK